MWLEYIVCTRMDWLFVQKSVNCRVTSIRERSKAIDEGLFDILLHFCVHMSVCLPIMQASHTILAVGWALFAAAHPSSPQNTETSLQALLHFPCPHLSFQPMLANLGKSAIFLMYSSQGCVARTPSTAPLGKFIFSTMHH